VYFLMTGAAVAAVLVGCRPASEPTQAQPTVVPRPVRVIASTPLVAELVEKVGGPGVEVEVLVDVDQPPASLRRTGPIESRLVAAELVVLLGFGQEAVLAPSLARAAEAGAVICELGAGVPADRLFPRIDDPGQSDPHIWLDPALWAEATRPLVESLAGLRPAWAEEWRSRAHAVRFDLDETARALQRLANTGLPTDPQPLRTNRGGLRYLARAAGLPLEVVSGPEAPAQKDELESFALDQLRAPGVVAVAGAQEHDLSTVDGLRAYALDLMQQRRP
jgi:manganese/zinc/iron transport system substrate-binding protein